MDWMAFLCLFKKKTLIKSRKVGEVGMSYKSPIELIMGQLQTSIEDQIFSAVQQVGINVDKEELIKALNYNREQYWHGYQDRDAEIVRCKDCKHYAVEDHCGNFHGYKILAASDVPTCHRWGNDTVMVKPDGYCFLGERR